MLEERIAPFREPPKVIGNSVEIRQKHLTGTTITVQQLVQQAVELGEPRRVTVQLFTVHTPETGSIHTFQFNAPRTRVRLLRR
ncbi:hypothetical protein AUJ14_01225 [Candidatus Micrarchaeota archaeon CG1_02_55_22]|nr:MAG: hypothetical protein AUJ14_01225 [Candidatus Micrarchaeota archaeon CG1_02_55_22]